MKVFRIIMFLFVLVCFVLPIKANALEVQVNTKSGLYVRNSATTSSKIVGGLVNNTKVNVNEDKVSGSGCSNGWYKITSGKYNGKYICSNYVKASSTVSNKSNSITNNTIVEKDVFEEKVVSVTTGLNLRESATTKSKVLKRLAVNKNYIATERLIVENSGCKNNTWYKIEVNDTVGYVCSAYLRDGASSDKYIERCNYQISDEKARTLGVNTNETFVEVDLTKQKTTLYINGVCNIITSTVTGKEDPARDAIDTTPGSFRITEKKRSKYFTLSNVYSNYWMRFNLGMGLHDADNWRSSYGFRGSHGCVNMPLTAAKIIYDNVEIGTRVIVHK